MGCGVSTRRSKRIEKVPNFHDFAEVPLETVVKVCKAFIILQLIRKLRVKGQGRVGFTMNKFLRTTASSCVGVCSWMRLRRLFL